MGKSSKAKEKKQKRLEERAAMAAVCAKVEAANKVNLLKPAQFLPRVSSSPLVLSHCPPSTPSSNPPPHSLNVSIECKRVASLERATVDWAFELTKANMQTL
uniref:Uncharacterized protein n=1 Tax=Pavo cristatus TaxID=9049 RepID=A0A8C9FVG6_PAVCR